MNLKNGQKPSITFSSLDKWKQLKSFIEDLRFIMVVVDYEEITNKVHKTCKIRGSRISWSAGDNACLNFFSSIEIQKGFLNFRERRGEKGPFRDSIWEDSNLNFRLVIKNPKKEKFLFLYFNTNEKMHKVIFYFKYQLHIKKFISSFGSKIDLAAVWKTSHYFEPFLQTINSFCSKYKHLSQQEFYEESKKFIQPTEFGKNEYIVENQINTETLKQHIAENDSQISYQIFDFEIVGMFVIDKQFMNKDELRPLRNFGDTAFEHILKEEEIMFEAKLRENLKELDDSFEKDRVRKEFNNQKDFKKKMTIKKSNREKIQKSKAPIDGLTSNIYKMNHNIGKSIYESDSEENKNFLSGKFNFNNFDQPTNKNPQNYSLNIKREDNEQHQYPKIVFETGRMESRIEPKITEIDPLIGIIMNIIYI